MRTLIPLNKMLERSVIKTIRIWGRPNSECTMRILWAVAEAGLASELTLASAIMGPRGHISKGGPPFGIVDTLEYRAMNPHGTVPTIVDGDYVLWESHGILAYIALTYAPTLYGNDFRTFARATSWISWLNENLVPPVAAIQKHANRLAAHLREPKLAEAARRDIARPLRALDTHLAGQPFLAGRSFTIADIAGGPTFHRYMLFCPAGETYPHLNAWHARLAAREGFRRHVLPGALHIDPD